MRYIYLPAQGVDMALLQDATRTGKFVFRLADVGRVGRVGRVGLMTRIEHIAANGGAQLPEVRNAQSSSFIRN